MVKITPSEREMDVLKVLWALGESPVRTVHEALCQEGKCAFTTVQTLLKIMSDKGLVKRRIDRRTLYYAPQYTAEQASVRFLHKVFDGSVDKLVLNMLQAEDLSADELRQLERLIAKARRQKEKEGQ